MSRGGAGERGSRTKRAEVGPVSRATERTDRPLRGSLSRPSQEGNAKSCLPGQSAVEDKGMWSQLRLMAFLTWWQGYSRRGHVWNILLPITGG